VKRVAIRPFGLAAVVAAALWGPTAWGGDAQVTRPISARDAAALLMQAGKIPEAKRVLAMLEKSDPKDNEVQFLLGMIAVRETRYADAIHRFHAILVSDPKAVRVRLELARAFFLAKDYDNAERQFRRARAGALSPAVTANIDRYLVTIRASRRWTHALSIALAPDTNVNVGPGVTSVGLYGLPFTLSPSARPRSGVGVNVAAGGEWSPPVSKNVRLRIGGQINTTDYRYAAVDDTTIAAYAGPRFFAGRWDVSPLLTGFYRLYGNRFYNEGIGGSVQTIYYPNARLGVTATVGAQQVTFTRPSGQGGLAVSGALGFVRPLSPASVLSGGVSVARQNAGLSVYANTLEQIRLGYDRDLTHGVSISIQPSYAWIDYDAAQAAFGITRRDRQLQTQVAILNRRIDVYGFTPRLAYTYTHNASSIPLYAYERHQVQMGLTRAF